MTAMHAWKTLTAAAAIAFAVPASAGVVTFSTAPYGPGFTGPVAENGYVYQQTDGSLFVNVWGNPGQNMEALAGTAGGALVVYRQNGGTFHFDSIDFASYEPSGLDQQFLSLVGVTKSGKLFQEFYTLNNTSIYSPQYANWTTEYPTLGGLAGLELKSLAIVLYSAESTIPCYGAVDNVVLSDINREPGVPEPATLALFGAGLAGFFARRRKG
jgi:hypothetical protein